MLRTQTAVGIDIGAHAFKAVVVRRRGSRTSLLRAGTIELDDLAFLDDSPRRDQHVGELLRLLVRTHRIRGGVAGAGLAGRDYFIKYLHVPPAPPDKLRKLIQYEVAEDPSSGAGEQTSDFWLLDLPSKSEEFTVMVVLARNDALNRRLGLLRRGRLRVEGITLNAIGLFNAYVHAMDEGVFDDQTVLLVDIGARHTEVVVQRNAKILFVRNLTLGGLRFSEALQEEFHLPIGEAEALKLSQGAILPRHFDAAADLDADTADARVSAALIEPAEAIYDTLQATINYCKAQTRLTDLRVDKVVLSGRGACLPGLRDFLAHRFRIPVVPLEPFASIDTSSLPASRRDGVLDDAPSYAVALGLALRQLDEGRARPITLLPAAVARRRAFLARDAFLYAGAATFALAFAAMFYSSSSAASRSRQEAEIMAGRIQKAKVNTDEFQGHRKRNEILAKQAAALGRLLDTGRRCADAIATLKKRVPPQLRIDTITAVTERPSAAVHRRRREKTAAQPKLTTHLLVEGSVAEKDGSRTITLAAALSIVNDFLKSLSEETHLYSSARVTKYPDPREPVDQRTFKMKVYFADPFYGGKQESVRR